jgi:hypothetical protein
MFTYFLVFCYMISMFTLMHFNNSNVVCFCRFLMDFWKTI